MTLFLFILLAASDNDALKQFREFLKDSSETINTAKRIQVNIEFDLPLAPQRAAGKLKILVTRFDSFLKISGVSDLDHSDIEGDGKQLLLRYSGTKEYFTIASDPKTPDQLFKFFKEWDLYNIDLHETLEDLGKLVGDELTKSVLVRQAVSPPSDDIVYARGATQLKLTRNKNTESMTLLMNNKTSVVINYRKLDEKDLPEPGKGISQAIKKYESNPPKEAIKIEYSKGDTFSSLLQKINSRNTEYQLFASADLSQQKKLLKVAIPSTTFITKHGSNMKISKYLGCFNVEFKEGGKSYCVIQGIEQAVKEQDIKNWITKERTIMNARIVQVKDPGVNKHFTYVFLKKGHCLCIPDVEINDKIVDIITEAFDRE